MTKQKILFDDPSGAHWPPGSRRTDPETSRAADVETSIDGTKAAHAQRALDLVSAYPGATALELAQAEGLGDPRIVNRRLPELEAMGLVRRGDPRRCNVSGRRATTWHPDAREAGATS